MRWASRKGLSPSRTSASGNRCSGAAVAAATERTVAKPETERIAAEAEGVAAAVPEALAAAEAEAVAAAEAAHSIAAAASAAAPRNAALMTVMA
ncbi:hypothetical protein RugamoR57_56140 [Duganella caerulea]